MSFIDFDYLLLIRLVTALVCGGIIGLERGGNNHEAGLRTHMLLCLGAALVMITSISMVEYYNVPGEVMRMSAQIISGIGFLGAGSIIADGNKIRGITTAAGLWTTACVGLTVGAGYYVLAGFTVLLVLFVMVALKPITERLKANSKNHILFFEMSNREVMHDILEKIVKEKAEILELSFEDAENGFVRVRVEVEFYKRASIEEMLLRLSENTDVKTFKIVE